MYKTRPRPREQYIYHAAGLDGRGGSSYIDAVICREWDKNSEGSAPGDEALEDRTFYAQNSRGDAVALLTGGGTLIETVRYSAYGVPFGAPAGDTDADGDYDAADKDRIADTLLAYDVRRDVNLDGVVDSGDITAAGSSGQTLGWGVLSKPGTASRRGYAGYESEPALAGQWTVYHARHRYYLADWQRWFTRDPLGYVDGMNMYAYVRGMALVATDPLGLCICQPGTVRPRDRRIHNPGDINNPWGIPRHRRQIERDRELEREWRRHHPGRRPPDHRRYRGPNDPWEVPGIGNPNAPAPYRPDPMEDFWRRHIPDWQPSQPIERPIWWELPAEPIDYPLPAPDPEPEPDPKPPAPPDAPPGTEGGKDRFRCKFQCPGDGTWHTVEGSAPPGAEGRTSRCCLEARYVLCGMGIPELTPGTQHQAAQDAYQACLDGDPPLLLPGDWQCP